MQFVEVYCEGKQPEARFNHSMHWYPRGNYLIVYGGKRFVRDGSPTEFLNDMHLLRMDTLTWFKV